MNQRVLKLMERLALDQREAVLVHNPSNMFYLSGYTGEGLVLIGREMQAIITDFRYTEQAEKQAPGFSVEMTEKGVSHEAIVGRLCAEHEIGALYYEDDYLTVRSFESCRKAVPGVEWKSLHEEVQHIRQIKDEDELSRIAEACRITSEAFERLLPEIKEGVTEKELALKLEFDMLTHGATGLAFSTIVAAGANGSLPHAVPGDYKVRLGDMITFALGAKYNGYCADMTRTVALGQPSDEMRRVYDIVLQAQLAGIAAAKAGVTGAAIDGAARQVIADAGYGAYFGHSFGHSLGIDIHESPNASPANEKPMPENAVVSAEPGIYLPGKFGVRIEDVMVLRPDGAEIITRAPKALLVL